MTLDELFAVPPDQRGETWFEAVCAVVPDARVTVTEPVRGADGFPYLALASGGPTTVRDVLHRCLGDGLGIAVWGGGPQPEVTFIYGDLWSFRETGRFVVSAGPPVTLTEPREARVGAPNDAMLPPYARAALRREMASQGLAEPTVILVRTPGYDPEWSFAFRPRPDRRVLWYLPRHYGLLVADDAWTGAPL